MRHSGLPLAIAGSHTCTHTLPEHHRAQNADHLAHNTPFSAFFTKVVCDLGATPPQVAASPSPIGGIARHEPPTRRRHAARRRRVVQNPHDRRCGGRRRIRRVAVPGCGARGQQRGLAGLRGDAPSEARGADDSRTGRRPRAHKAARPKQQCEGRCTRYGPLHPLRGGTPDQKGCTAYGSGAAHPITRTNAESARRGPGCGTRGRRGLAGLRDDAPSEARSADDSRAGRRPRAHKAARPKQQCEGRCTRYGPLHPLRGGTPDQKGCTAYGSGAAHPATRTNAESARRPPTRTGPRELTLPGPSAFSDHQPAFNNRRSVVTNHRSAANSPSTIINRRSADTPRRAVAAIRDGDAGSGQAVA